MARQEQWKIDAEAETSDLTDDARIVESGIERLTSLGLPILEPYDSNCPHCAGQPLPKDPRENAKLMQYRNSLCRQCMTELWDEISRFDLWNAVLQDEDQEFDDDPDMSYP